MTVPFRASVTVPLLALALAALAAGACSRHVEAAPPVPDPRPKVTVALPVPAAVADYSEHTGRTEAPSVVELRARVSGHLLRAPFREGDLVRKGDLLFVVDPRPFQAAVARARAEVASIRADHALAAK